MTRLFRSGVPLIVALALAGLTPHPAHASVIPLQKVALTGDAPAGIATVRYARFGVPAINASGETAFSASFLPVSPNTEPAAPYNSGVWRGTPGTLSMVTWSGPDTPFADLGRSRGYANVMINDAGHVAYVAVTEARDSNRVRDVSTIWSTRNGGATQLVARKDDLPGADPAFVDSPFYPARMDADGRIAFATEASVPPRTVHGLWHWDGSTTRAVAIPGVTPPPATLGSYQQVVPTYFHLSRDGKLLFHAYGTTPDDDFGGTAIVVPPGGRGGDAAVLSGDRQFIDGGPLRTVGPPLHGFNDAGQALYNGPTLGTTGDAVALREADGRLRMVALEGQQAPGLPAGHMFGGTFKPVLAGNGAIAVRAAALREPQGPATFGVWYGTPGDLQLIEASGRPAPDARGATFWNIDSVTANARGDVAYTGYLTGGDVTPADNYGLFVRTVEGETHLIVRAGDLIDVDPTDGIDLRTVGTSTPGSYDAIGFNFATTPTYAAGGEDGLPSGFAGSGALALRLRFTDGSEGIFTTTIVPEPASIVLPAAVAALLLTRRRALKRRRVLLAERVTNRNWIAKGDAIREGNYYLPGRRIVVVGLKAAEPRRSVRRGAGARDGRD